MSVYQFVLHSQLSVNDVLMKLHRQIFLGYYILWDNLVIIPKAEMLQESYEPHTFM